MRAFKVVYIGPTILPQILTDPLTRRSIKITSYESPFKKDKVYTVIKVDVVIVDYIEVKVYTIEGFDGFKACSSLFREVEDGNDTKEIAKSFVEIKERIDCPVRELELEEV